MKAYLMKYHFIISKGMSKIQLTFEKEFKMIAIKKKSIQKYRWIEDFPGGPVVKTPCSHCRRPGFHPWSGK